MPSILFVCTANQFRSPLAAAIFRCLLKRDGKGASWQVASAGTWTRPALPPDPRAEAAALRLGLDISGHRTRLVTAELLEWFDLILVMEPGHREALSIEFPASIPRLVLLPELVDGIPSSIPDPNDPRADPDQIARDLLRLLVRGYHRILEAAQSNLQNR